MGNNIQIDPGTGQTPAALLLGFVDSAAAAAMLGRSRATVCDMADRGVLTRYAVGSAVLYWRDEVADMADALRRIKARP